jgi:transposase
LKFCYEAGPCGYGVHHTLTKLGEDCMVVAPSMIPRKSGDRQKNDKRDAANLAVLHRGGLLTAVWVPDAAHEAMRDLIRARLAAVRSVRTARQQLSAFLLRHERIYPDGRPSWTNARRRWLADQHFAQPAQQIVLEENIEAVRLGEQRRDRVDGYPIRVPQHDQPSLSARPPPCMPASAKSTGHQKFRTVSYVPAY